MSGIKAGLTAIKEFLGGGESIITQFADTADRFILTKEEKQEFQKELKTLAIQQQLRNKELENEIDKLILEDVQNARQREIEINADPDSSKLAKALPSILALAVTFLAFALCFILVFVHIEDSQKDIVIYLLGFVSSIVIQVFSYHFGSSKAKDSNDRKMISSLNK